MERIAVAVRVCIYALNDKRNGQTRKERNKNGGVYVLVSRIYTHYARQHSLLGAMPPHPTFHYPSSGCPSPAEGILILPVLDPDMFRFQSRGIIGVSFCSPSPSMRSYYAKYKPVTPFA